jgi:hypothetical protein
LEEKRIKTSIYVSAELWRRFKAKCALEGKGVSEEIERLLREACKESGGKT